MRPCPRILATLATLAGLALSAPIARAAWTALPIPAAIAGQVDTARVCKTAVNSAYGLLWRANFQVFRKSTRASSIWVSVVRQSNGTLMHQQRNDQWLYGVVAGTGGQVYASPFQPDQFQFGVSVDGNAHFLGSAYPPAVATC